MEEGFDLSQIKWILIFAVFVIYKFFNSKLQEPQELEEGEQIPGSTIEELLGRFEQSVEQEQEPRQKVVKAVKMPKKAATPKITSDDLASSEIGQPASQDEAFKVGEFDLRQAVIMSEILNRKYDE